MTVPHVSIITPTFNRPQFLPFLAKCVLEQSVSDFEWLILDDSPQPSLFMQALADPRIVYEHSPEKKTIGDKRNRLVGKSRAAVIAQFDDDDHYAPGYLSAMLAGMSGNNVDIVKLFGFFLYSKRYKTLGYWDLMTKLGPHWLWSLDPASIVMLTQDNNQSFKDNHLGFGFCYVFKKKVWEQSPFPEVDWNEDGAFMLKALERFRLAGLHDHQCTCVHVLHEWNTSACFPQYLMPNFLVRMLFPNAQELLAA